MNGTGRRTLEMTLDDLRATRNKVNTMTRPVILQRHMFERILTTLRRHAPDDPECRALLAELRFA